MLATEFCPTHRTEYFIEGSQPAEPCTLHSGGQPIPASSPTPDPWPEGKSDQTPGARDSNKNKHSDPDLENQQRPREVMKQRPPDKTSDNSNRDLRRQGNRTP